MLKIEVDQAGRKALLATGEQIALVRPMKGAPAYVVVAAVFRPFGLTTIIGFNPQWQVYVMQGAIQPMKQVNMQLTCDTAPGQQYSFDGVEIGSEQPAFDGSVFGLVNATTEAGLSAGLAQQLTVDNTDNFQAIHVAGFPANATSYFEPEDFVWVFVVSGVVAGEVLPASMLVPIDSRLAPVVDLPGVVGKYLAVSVTSDSTIHFDDGQNCFRPGPLAG
jgi:hypothetical protein